MGAVNDFTSDIFLNIYSRANRTSKMRVLFFLLLYFILSIHCAEEVLFASKNSAQTGFQTIKDELVMQKIAELSYENTEIKKTVDDLKRIVQELRTKIKDNEEMEYCEQATCDSITKRISDEQVRAAGQEMQLRTEINETSCELTKLKEDNITNIEQSIEKFRKTPRFVAVVQNPTLDYSLPLGTITYDELLVNFPTSSFDSNTGTFTAPQEGIYIFNFDGFVYGKCNVGFIHFNLNGEDTGHYIEQSTDSTSSRGISGIRAITLKSGDEITLNESENGECIRGDD